jgi:hypothetical protein
MKGGIVRALQLDLARSEAEATKLYAGLYAFRCHLHSDKFAGEGRDWISTADVLNWIRELEGAGQAAKSDVVACPVCSRAMVLGSSCPHGCPGKDGEA